MTGIMRIRPYKKEDGKYLKKWLSEERMMRLWCRDYFAYPLTEDQLEKYYGVLEENLDSWSFTAMADNGIPVGSFRISRVDYEAESIHLGFIIIDPEKHGQGYGEQMVSMAVRYGQEFLKMKRITLNVFECNPGARRCYEKVGFEVEEYMAADYEFKEEAWGIYRMVIAANP